MQENFIPKDIKLSAKVLGQVVKGSFEGVKPAIKIALARKVEKYHRKLLRK